MRFGELVPDCASRKSGKIWAGTNCTVRRILSSDAHFPARTSDDTGFDPSFAPWPPSRDPGSEPSNRNPRTLCS